MENHRVDDKETQLNIDDADRSTNVQGVASTTTNISSDDKQVNIESNSIEKNVPVTTSATTNIHSDKDEDTLVNMKDDDILVINS
jgi:hypothetical protein